MRSKKVTIEDAELTIQAIDRSLARLNKQKADLQFLIGRLSADKKVSRACRTLDGNDMCADCDCWKKTRESCS